MWIGNEGSQLIEYFKIFFVLFIGGSLKFLLRPLYFSFTFNIVFWPTKNIFIMF